MALDGKTPDEAAGIRIEGENEWLTLIQNASHCVMHLTDAEFFTQAIL